MNILKTPIEDLVIIEPKVYGDERGYFLESYQYNRYKEQGISANFIQDNEAFSMYGVVRGLHFQKGKYAQAKLVRVIEGAVYDVAVDLRKNSKTYGQWYGIELSAQNKRQFFVPRGFAHGYSVISETATFAYKCDNDYYPTQEGGINVNDVTLGIDWKIPVEKQIISEKDKILPSINEIETGF